MITNITLTNSVANQPTGNDEMDTGEEQLQPRPNQGELAMYCEAS